MNKWLRNWRARPKKDRSGSLYYKIFGPATVEGAVQGGSKEAREHYKRLRANQKRAAQERRRQRDLERGA